MHQTLILPGRELAYVHHSGSTPGILFCGGFNSNMQGNKALHLERHCLERGWQFTRFDYQGHGLSSGEFAATNIDTWLQDTLDIIDRVCSGLQIIVGSSMGGWLATLATLARRERIGGLLGIAVAPDFTEELIWEAVSDDVRRLLSNGSQWSRPSTYDDGAPYPITMHLIESGRKHLLLADSLEKFEISCPIRLLHGNADQDVPYSLSKRLLEKVDCPDATLQLIKNGDHRLSSEGHLATIVKTLDELQSITTLDS